MLDPVGDLSGSRGLVPFTTGDSKVVFLATGVRFSGGGARKVVFLATGLVPFTTGDLKVLSLAIGVRFSGAGACEVLLVASVDPLVGTVEVMLGMM